MAEGRILYRPAEAAEALGVSRARLYQLLAANEIGSVKIGVSRRIPAVDLQQYVDRLRSQSGAELTDAPRASAAA